MKLFPDQARNNQDWGRKVKKRTLNKVTADEKGQALIIVLILLLLGGLIIAPMLSYMGSGLKTGKDVYEERMYGQYAADSGVEDALYKIQVDDAAMPDEWEEDPWAWDAYSTPYTYSMPSPVNGNDVEVTIQPQWILADLEDPPPGMTPHADIVIVGDTMGTVNDNGLYQISINYTLDMRELHIERIGAYLPNGFSYVPGSSNLEADSGAVYYCVPEVSPHRGGWVIKWDFDTPRPKFDELPSDGEKGIVTFEFSPPGRPGAAFSWVVSQPRDVYISWDTDLKLYQINSEATDVNSGRIITVDAFAAKNELREMGTAISGDYRAIGATLMIDEDPWNNPPRRDTLLDESDATASGITSGAYVEAAYLYWSAWLEDGQTVFLDNCSNFNYWQPPGSRWSVFEGFEGREFMGRGGGGDAASTLTLNYPPTGNMDLSPYSDQTIRVSWEQRVSDNLESDDYLYLAVSGDGGSTWSGDIEAFAGDNPTSIFTYFVPGEYVTNSFKMMLFLDFGQGNEYIYINNIRIDAVPLICDDSVFFEIDGTGVYFDSDGDPAVGDYEITADENDCHVLTNFTGEGELHGFSYACSKDVTELVRLLTTNGNGTYTVGGVYGDTGDEWSYAAWSLIIIYSSPWTKGHQLYLYDDRFIYSDMNCNVDFDGDGNPGGIISGFLSPEDIMDEDYAAHATCFVGEGDEYYGGDPPDDIDCILVNGDYLSNSESPWDNVWNSKSPDLAEDGIDIDTFEIQYPTIRPGDTSAQVDLPTGIDSWNLVYIILSFRSDVTTGGTISYLLRG